MRSRRLGVLFVAGLSLAHASSAEVIERILAVVDGRPVMLTDVLLLSQVRGVDAKQALEATIDERLMAREAARLASAAPTPAEEEKAFLSIRQKVPADAPVSDEDLRRLARREAQILKYIEFRFRPQVRVDDQEIRAAYEREYAGASGAPSFESAAPNLRERLSAKNLDERIEAWIKDLRAAADVRYNP